MTVAELIRELQRFPPDQLVIKRDGRHYVPRWETMDGHWFQQVEVVRRESFGCEPYYGEPSRGEIEDGAQSITALEL